MALFDNKALIENPALRRFPGDDRAWRTFIQTLNSQQITTSGIPPGSQGWVTTTAFSATDADTVAWGAGTLTTADGTAYSIGAGNTGNMVARTYVYFDIDVSTTAYQTTTTAGDSVGGNKILVAVCEDTTTEAFFQVFGGIGGVLVTANEIAANTITANEIAATTITGSQISSLSISGKTLTADTGTVGGWTMASGSLSSGNMTLNSTAEEIEIGSATAPLTGTGIWIGKDGTNYELRAGDPAGEYVHWDGANLTVIGDTINWNSIQTFTPGWTGFSSSPTGDVSYLDMGVWAMIAFPAQRSGTSNSTSFTMTGLPAAITPSVSANIGGVAIIDASVALYGKASVNAGGTVSFNVYDADNTTTSRVNIAGWTASLTKGVQSGVVLVYPL